MAKSCSTPQVSTTSPIRLGKAYVFDRYDSIFFRNVLWNPRVLSRECLDKEFERWFDDMYSCATAERMDDLTTLIDSSVLRSSPDAATLLVSRLKLLGNDVARDVQALGEFAVARLETPLDDKGQCKRLTLGFRKLNVGWRLLAFEYAVDRHPLVNRQTQPAQRSAQSPTSKLSTAVTGVERTFSLYDIEDANSKHVEPILQALIDFSLFYTGQDSPSDEQVNIIGEVGRKFIDYLTEQLELNLQQRQHRWKSTEVNLLHIN